MPIVLDDALLLAVIAGTVEDVYGPVLDTTEEGELFTTSSWYWRLSRAVAHSGRGALSRPFGDLSDTEQVRVRSSLAVLPTGIGLLEARKLIPVMAALPGQLNFLTAEAVAAAIVVDGTIAVTTESALLARTAQAVGVNVDLIERQA